MVSNVVDVVDDVVDVVVDVVVDDVVENSAFDFGLILVAERVDCLRNKLQSCLWIWNS